MWRHLFWMELKLAIIFSPQCSISLKTMRLFCASRKSVPHRMDATTIIPRNIVCISISCRSVGRWSFGFRARKRNHPPPSLRVMSRCYLSSNARPMYSFSRWALHFKSVWCFHHFLVHVHRSCVHTCSSVHGPSLRNSLSRIVTNRISPKLSSEIITRCPWGRKVWCGSCHVDATIASNSFRVSKWNFSVF